MWLRELCSCSCLPVLPGSAWVLLRKIFILFSRSLYNLCSSQRNKLHLDGLASRAPGYPWKMLKKHGNASTSVLRPPFQVCNLQSEEKSIFLWSWDHSFHGWKTKHIFMMWYCSKLTQIWACYFNWSDIEVQHWGCQRLQREEGTCSTCSSAVTKRTMSGLAQTFAISSILASLSGTLKVGKPTYLAVKSGYGFRKRLQIRSLSLFIFYRDGLKSGPVLLSNSQAGPGRKFSQPWDHFLAQLCTYLLLYLCVSPLHVLP